MQSSSQIITTNKPTPNFLQAGCPSCHPINSVKALKRKKSEIKSISRQLLNIAFTAFTGCQTQLMTCTNPSPSITVMSLLICEESSSPWPKHGQLVQQNKQQLSAILHTVTQKSTFYFHNNFVKSLPILIIFGTQMLE